MAINSRDKGGVGEREVSHMLVDDGFCEHAERTAQRCGKGGTADVVGLHGVHIEVKRTEKLNIWKAMSQAVRDAVGAIPSVWHRRNRDEWLVTVRYRDLRAFSEAIVDNCRRVDRLKNSG
jgi:hypothetical protein